MARVVMHAVTSVDGFIADEHEVGPLFDWYFNGDRPLTDNPEAPFRVSATSEPYDVVMPGDRVLHLRYTVPR